MSAHLCLIAWKLPIGRPNCTRTLAYSTRHVETLLRAADLLGRQRHRGEVEHALEHRPALAVGAEQRGRRAVELEAGLLARLVHGLPAAYG